jgi:glycine/D-amino acid oxidase-like deaminating enzyme
MPGGRARAAKGACRLGATVENVRVLEIEHRDRRVTGVKTSTGNTKPTMSSPAAGWTRQLGLRCGVTIPLYQSNIIT